MHTKEKILEVALELFSQRGFSAVSVRDIAARVGVREGALYRHFPNKQAVHDTLVARYKALSDAAMAAAHALPTGDPAKLESSVAFYMTLDDETFLAIAMGLFTDFLMRPEVMRFWRMVSIEQYHDPAMADLFHTLLFAEPIAFQTTMFGMLIAQGALRPAEPELLAVEFFTPALMMYLRLLPFMDDAQKTEESLAFFRQHVLHFRQTYANPTQNERS